MTKIRSGVGKAEKHITQIAEWVAMGKENTWIANEIGTSEASIRRARIRHNIATPRPEDISALTGVKGLEWGYGRAEKVKPLGGDYEHIVVLSDIHFPYQDDAVVESALKLIKAAKPHRVILNGDINDFFQLSRFNTEFDRLDELQDEIDQANRFRRAVRQAAPNAVIDETEGNHDNRITSFVMKNAKALHTLRALRPENLFLYDELEINWHPGAGFLLRDNFLVKHGTAISNVNGSTAKAELKLNGISGVSGHVHRSEQARQNNYAGAVWGVSGCMCRLDPDYIIGLPNWDQGILVVEISNLSGHHSITNVPMVDGKLRYGGRSY